MPFMSLYLRLKLNSLEVMLSYPRRRILAPMLGVCLALAACIPSTIGQPNKTAPMHSTGLLVVGHGAGPEWNAAVRTTVSQVSWAGPVEVAFLMGTEALSAGWDSAVMRLERAGAASIVVVPLMVSTHGSHHRQILHYAGQLPELPPELASHAHAARRPSVPVRVTSALDGAPEMARALAAHWSALPDAQRRRPVVLVGHGPGSDADAAQWIAQFGRAATGLSAAGLRSDVRSGLLRDDADAPVRAAAVAAMRDTISALASRTGDSVVVLGVAIARSGLTRVTIPTDLAGLPVQYVPAPLTPSPAIAEWIGRVARQAGGWASGRVGR